MWVIDGFTSNREDSNGLRSSADLLQETRVGMTHLGVLLIQPFRDTLSFGLIPLAH